MLASQQFCVKWNSYSTNLQNVFPRLLTSEHFVDITLACEGQMIKCHKVVLSACSTYFEKLLVQNPCQHPIIFMKDMKHWEVQALVDFMYKGEVNVSQDELSSLLVAAEALQIRGLCGSDHMGRGTALPQDTVLSGSGRESPASKRKRVDDSPQTSSRPCQSTSTTKLSNSDSDIVASLEQTQDENCEITETEIPERKSIKQEVDIDENFGDDGLENDRSEEHYANHEAQDDSDSKEQPQSPRDQPGPSGLPPNQTLTADKAATDFGRDAFFGRKFPGAMDLRVMQNCAHFLLRPPHKQYSPHVLDQAVEDFRTGKFNSIRACARHHGVPMTTLHYRVKLKVKNAELQL